MPKGFVFGKFLPFHKGHEGMIRFALQHCDALTVLVCASDRENIPAEKRVAWITETFQGQAGLAIRAFNYKEDELPNSSESSRDISRVWANAFKKLLPDQDLLITSEPYGDYVADYMGIQHIPYDIPRTQFPVSATVVRKKLLSLWRFLPDSVKPDFAIKVVILGTESTGKSVLTEKLAAHFNASIVMEAGRDLIPHSNHFELADLYRVAEEHARRIDLAVRGDHPLVIIDTDIHTTMSYARFFLGETLSIPPNIQQSNAADLYLYLNNDVDFMQDGSRLTEPLRNQLDLSHRAILSESNISYVEIYGDWVRREKMAIAGINALLAARQQT